MNISIPGYWDQRYANNRTEWDMHRVSPPLKAYFDQLSNPSLAILIPGCGNAYEAAYLLEKGFSSITLIDISPVLTAQLKEKFKSVSDPPLRIITGDFFDHTGQYDLIIEQTFFCAFDPSLRENYMEKMALLLSPGGRLAGLLFDRDFPDGPPFGGHKDEYENLLKRRFALHTLAPCHNSIPPRAGTELFFIAKSIPSAPAGSDNENYPAPR